ncbi:hypothetical protein ACFWB0_01545 [Rhodococcus sp. NPDC060086]|uniref:hypothetical protein n=1 Tax=unclassified Rhodococcus (in: high G+C Gram-positive bacteria) TaxID=192944 RepID=UPI0036600781
MTIQFAPATTVPDYYADDRRTAGDGAGSRFWPGFSVGVCAATMVGALIATGFVVADRTPLFAISGTVTLIDGAASSSTSGFECEGARGYDDISPTAAVRVSDAAGALLATGSLTHSVSEGNFCTFFFTVPEVPRGAASYDVEISHRGSVSYNETEADSGVHLTLGN